MVLVDHSLKINKRYKNSRNQEVYNIFIKMNLIKVQHDMVYGDFKNLTRRTAFDKILRDKAFNIAKNPKYDGYQMVYNGFDDSYFFLIKRLLLRVHNQRPYSQRTHPRDLCEINLLPVVLLKVRLCQRKNFLKSYKH